MNNQNDSAKFAAVMFGLCTAFDKPANKQLTDLYFKALADLEIETVERAAELAINQCRFFPKVAELRELVSGTPEDAGTAAWELLVTAIQRIGFYTSLWIDSPTLADTLRRTFGTWTQACTDFHPIYDDDGRLIGGLSQEMVAARRKVFLQNYRNAARERRPTDRYFPGNHEANNASSAGSWKRGELSGTMPVGLICGGQVSRVSLPIDPYTARLARSARQMLEAGEGAKLLAAPPPVARPLQLVAKPALTMTADEALSTGDETFNGLEMLRGGLPAHLRSKRTPERKPLDVVEQARLIREQRDALNRADEEKETA